MGTQVPLRRGAQPPIIGPNLLWPNGWMDQDAIWYREVSLSPSDIVLDGDPVPPPPKGGGAPVFGPCLLWSNGWMDEDATWYGSRPQPDHIVLDGDPAPPSRKGNSSPPLFGPYLLWLYGRPSQLLLSSCFDNFPMFADSFSVLCIYCVARGLGASFLYKFPAW